MRSAREASNLLPVTPFRPLGAGELAERWGVSRQRVEQIRREDPRLPIGTKLTHGYVWNLEEIEAYERETGRQPVGDDSQE